MQFDLKQLSLGGGIFGLLNFIGIALWIWIYPVTELHQTLLLEMTPGLTWPLSFAGILLGLVIWFVWGALLGMVLALCLNLFSRQQ